MPEAAHYLLAAERRINETRPVVSSSIESMGSLSDERVSLIIGEPIEIVLHLLARSPAALGMGISVGKAEPGRSNSYLSCLTEWLMALVFVRADICLHWPKLRLPTLALRVA